MPEKKFELGDYVEVKDRIKLFYELYAGGRLITKNVTMVDSPDGTQRVMVTALAYRTVDDPLPGVGTSWLALPGSTPYTRGSEVENAETSAWGRAIGSLGILIDRSIATSNEIENKADDGRTPAHPGVIGGMPTATPEGGLIGIAVAKGTQDFNLRQTPDGSVLPFRVKNGAQSFIVVAEGPLAEALDAIKSRVIDERVTVWGSWSDEETPAKGTKPLIRYRILHLERIATPDGILPAPAFDSLTGVPSGDQEAERIADQEAFIDAVTEAPTAPLFDDTDMAALDAELAS